MRVPQLRYTEVASRIRAAIRFDETARRLGVNGPSVELEAEPEAQDDGVHPALSAMSGLGAHRVPTQLAPDFISAMADASVISTHKSLPPLKLQSRSTARKHLVGRDAHYRPRETPRCLRPGWQVRHCPSKRHAAITSAMCPPSNQPTRSLTHLLTCQSNPIQSIPCGPAGELERAEGRTGGGRVWS